MRRSLCRIRGNILNWLQRNKRNKIGQAQSVRSRPTFYGARLALATVAIGWPNLPEAIKAGIVAMGKAGPRRRTEPTTPEVTHRPASAREIEPDPCSP